MDIVKFKRHSVMNIVDLLISNKYQEIETILQELKTKNYKTKYNKSNPTK